MYVVCDIGPGLRDEEIGVGVRGTEGRRRWRVEVWRCGGVG
jgi:hypothetical protein